MEAYLKDPAAIYAKSFETVRAEVSLARFPDGVTDVVVRLIHACGIPAIADDIAFTDRVVDAGRDALKSGAPIFVDANMVAAGIIRRHLTGNEIVCTLDDDGVADDAKRGATTRSAAAVERWVPRLEGAVVAIGNAPTALFRLLELIADGAPKPAVVLGFPVGFVGAAESKDALAKSTLGLEYITLNGRIGGSAIASAAVNALAGGLK
ncbi:MAG: precorrin-8X methylmutase [Rhodospirillales bacterium]|nr:precorrin-8X methylmutase [Rhodospirillales bacterium]MBO6788436.1 precorrin-8X methylmutase [Rhodospirillales bacterium]